MQTLALISQHKLCHHISWTNISHALWGKMVFCCFGSSFYGPSNQFLATTSGILKLAYATVSVQHSERSSWHLAALSLSELACYLFFSWQFLVSLPKIKRSTALLATAALAFAAYLPSVCFLFRPSSAP